MLPKAEGKEGQGERRGDMPVEHGPRSQDGKASEVQGVKGKGAKAFQPAYLNLTEDNAKAALVEARGDLFVASQLLGITAVRLDRAIAVSSLLQATIAAIRNQKLAQDHNLQSDIDFQQSIDRRLSLYRVVGLDALHDLATMPIDENSAQNQVKLAAAARLAGPTDGHSGSGEIESTLRELNEAYQKEAPRLRVIREKTTIETLPAERVVHEEASDK